jgi:hypothetical protein
MKIVVYHKTIPNQKNLEKIQILENFSIGIKRSGDIIVDSIDYTYIPSDVGIIQGWLGEKPSPTPHLKLRDTIINNQLANNKYVITADSNLFLYSTSNNTPHHYLRYSFNGVFPNTGIYCDSNVDSARWQQIKRDLNISLKDYRTDGSHILICLQRNGGWSMGSVDIQDWAVSTITEIRKYSDRPIIIRPHPGDKTSKQIIAPGNPNCKIPFSKSIQLSVNENIVDDLKNCWAAVNYNSSPVVAAAIEGVPIFVVDKEKSQCAEIANTDLSKIETPTLFNREKWAQRISMFHWNFKELTSGQCWQHMKSFI